MSLEARAFRSCMASGEGGGGAPANAAWATLADRGLAKVPCDPPSENTKCDNLHIQLCSTVLVSKTKVKEKQPNLT